ncbi:NepR family anti-sigma factor [Methylocystis hirsuta]
MQTTQGRRGAPGRSGAPHQLPFLRIDGELTSGLRDMYATSLIEPMPDKFLDLLVRLSTSVAKQAVRGFAPARS